MVKIFLEGKDKKVPETSFLKNILNSIGADSGDFTLLHTDGYTNSLNPLMPNITIMRANTDEGGSNLVIFDADTSSNGGGFFKRRELLLEGRSKFDLKFDLFLWPNNRDDGDVEMLMESIARKDLYPEFFSCFACYEQCILHRKNEKGESFYSSPNRKGKLHTYFNAIPISETKKSGFGRGNWRWSDSNIWNFEAESLKPIKDFLSIFIL